MWLTTIASHEGTATECSPLSDRAVLEALYAAAGGAKWTNRENWLSNVPLDEWYGVTVGDAGSVTSLSLEGNDLSGAVPPELGNLANLTELRLDGNDLSGAIPPELGNLANLTELRLDGNDLSGAIPPELGNLANLTELWLDGNDLSGAIPPELGNLVTLRLLDLGWNRLSGAIPPELGDLASLTGLRLDRNNLSGAIPPELGNLANLRSLDLGWNRLSGEIPSEIGNLAALRRLSLLGPRFAGLPGLTGSIPSELANLTEIRSLGLTGNDLTGGIPPGLGNLASLEWLGLSDNELTGTIPPELGNLSMLESLLLAINDLEGPVPPQLGKLASLRELTISRNARMSGVLPQSLTALSGLEVFVADDTELCAPSDADFLDWLDGVTVQRVALCGATEAMAYLTQAVQSPEFPVPLVAGEEALLRVFLTAGRSNDQDIPPVRATVFANDAETHVLDIPGKQGPIPTEVREGQLNTSANGTIPGHLVQPGLELLIEVDPQNTLNPALGVTKRIPETGRLAVDVRPMPLFDLTLIPFLWTESSDSTVLDITAGLTGESDLLWETRTLLPVSDFEVTVHAPVSSSSNNAYDLIAETRAIRVMEGGSGHYMGTMVRPVTGGVVGLASRPGRVSFSIPTGWIMAHELGHNMSLKHPWQNPLFPSYPEGKIGAWGYDFRYGELVPPDAYDIMEGCCWISDFHVAQALRFRHGEAPAVGAIRTADRTPTKSLLLWGGVAAEGVPYLEPAFVVDAPPALPDRTGDHRLVGRTAGGGDLFSLSFAMPETADGDGSSSFAFVLPVRPEWEGSLASVTLSGPGGSFTLDGDSDYPMAILRNAQTGQIRGILSDPPPATQAAADGVGQGAGLGLEVLFSRGIPDAEAWRR